ncbi:HAD family hydrolase [Desulfovibrio inopinatus]|uniref:HAD family hydrolase n=1 Tax=Desulfovibrio inopinatus TaxID=102109 RepID=UPI0004136B22|nr:HAD-IA family hydrolase [Desulfovibrio inopinatus]
MPICAIIFDFDGTLAELTLDFDIMKSRLFTMGHAYFDSPPSVYDRPALEWIEGSAGLLPEPQAKMFRQDAMNIIQGMEVEAATRGRLFPFTRIVFKKLRQVGIKTGIITRNCRPAVLTVFPDWAEYTDVLLTRDDVPYVKPNPAHLTNALERLAVPVEHGLMVGDHPMDIQTGKNAGTLTAGSASGRFSIHALFQAGADFAETNISILVDVLQKKNLVAHDTQSESIL